MEISPKRQSLAETVKARLGVKRLAGLSGQPQCLGSGGLDVVLESAAAECAGHPDPTTATAVRVIQLCGSVPKPEDISPKK